MTMHSYSDKLLIMAKKQKRCMQDDYRSHDISHLFFIMFSES